MQFSISAEYEGKYAKYAMHVNTISADHLAKV